MPNKLIHESSPYLLQHANNPVEWYPWGEEAFELARQQNKLLIVSIGYAACHWCHVMEHESFEDQEVADLMNAHFINIKVDREERPDVDKIYMDAVMIMRQQGGWPLNAVALPDKRPIFGGTYFPKEHWMDVLMQIVNLYKSNPQKTHEYADNLAHALKGLGYIVKVSNIKPFEQEEIVEMANGWLNELDLEWGGRKTSRNKFPLPMNNLTLLRLAHFLKNKDVKEAVDTTLAKMTFGGIYDHLGGGFARYSVDAYWKVPHFEKMLYDNGQLVSLYSEAWQQNPQEIYKRVVYQTLDFIQREMISEEGGFYSSLDADSEGEEGKFYVWSYPELEQTLGADAKLFADYYNVHPTGNWEGNNILFVLETEEAFATRWNLDVTEFKEKMAEGREKLFLARSPRIRPGLDDKILASWNALMLKGYVDAYNAFGEIQFLETAIKNAAFIRDALSSGGQLFRNYKNGKKTINAFLDDYAYLIEAYIALYQSAFDEQWLAQAQLHMEYVWQHFSDEQSGMFFYTSNEDEVLINRKMESQDDVIPSSNASLAHSLFNLGIIFDRSDYRERSLQMLQNMKAETLKNPGWYSYWVQLMLKHTFPHYEVAITGYNAQEYRKDFNAYYHPHRLFVGAKTNSDLPLLKDRFTEKTMVYICQEYACKLPVETVEAAVEQMV